MITPDNMEEAESVISALRKKLSSVDNSIGVIMTNALDAAREVHVATYHSGESREDYLLRALHCLLIIAEQCRQEMGKRL